MKLLAAFGVSLICSVPAHAQAQAQAAKPLVTELRE